MGLERLKALFCRRGSGDPLAFSKSEVFAKVKFLHLKSLRAVGRSFFVKGY